MNPDELAEEIRSLTEAMRSLSETTKRLGDAAMHAAFAILDYTLAVTPLEDRPSQSWEVEREEFIRRMDADEWR